MRIDIWSDLACPWCFIGSERLLSAVQASGAPATITWHAFQLDPSIPEHVEGSEVDYLVASKGMSRADVEQMTSHVAHLAAQDGLHLDFPSVKVANSRRAHHLVYLAQLHGVADPVVHDLMSAHFEHGEDIADRAVLARIGEAHGLTAEAIDEALDSPECDAAMSADADQAAGIGIQGVPFVVVDGRYAVSGAQPVETFAEALRRAGEDAADAPADGGCGCGGCSCGAR